jgi:hypothetical protein
MWFSMNDETSAPFDALGACQKAREPETNALACGCVRIELVQGFNDERTGVSVFLSVHWRVGRDMRSSIQSVLARL